MWLGVGAWTKENGRKIAVETAIHDSPSTPDNRIYPGVTGTLI